MKKPSPVPEQETLLAVEPADLAKAALRKVRSAREQIGLEAAELEALELAVKGELPKKTRFPNWEAVIGAWMSEYKAATGGKAPRLTDPEANTLKSAANRLHGAEATIKLIGAFWRWRKRQQEKFPAMASPQPTPFGFAKHLASVMEFAAEEEQVVYEAEKAKREKEAVERRFRERSAPLPTEPPPGSPTPDDIRRVKETLAAGMTRPYLTETRP